MHVNCSLQIRQKSVTNKWQTAANFQIAKMMLDDGCSLLEDETDCKAMGMKWYWGVVMPLSYHPSMDNCNYADQHCTIPPSEAPVDHSIPVPRRSPKQCKVVQLPTPAATESGLGKNTKNHRSDVGEYMMNQAKDGSGDGASTNVKKIITDIETAMLNPGK